jgi:asparagine synthase (glutamine-hydrolysing)
MCGICGFFFGSCHSKCSVDPTEAASLLAHRGPHGQCAYWPTPSLFLGFTRLAVVDLSANGNQPFIAKGYMDDKSSAVVCNGEIYNHLALKDLLCLEQKDSSDCCVILPGVSKWGIDEFLKRIDGMFAIALCSWSHTSDSVQVWLCRDRFGIKPLYWGTCTSGGCFSFSSEIKGIPDTWTLREVPPGHIVHLVQQNKVVTVTEQRFALPWEPSLQKFTVLDGKLNKILFDTRPLSSDIRATLSAAVKKQLMGDREVAVLLSGGVDSSLIAAIAARELARSGKHLATFTIHHDFGVSSDLLHAREAAKWIGSIHSEVSFSTMEGFEALERVIYHTETYDVITVRAAVPLYLLAKHVSKTHHVVLVGEGADELFGGYSLFSQFDEKGIVAFRAELSRRLSLISDSELLRVDRCTMAFGVEARVPYLDSKFASLIMHQGCDPEKLSHPSIGRIEKLLLVVHQLSFQL